MVSALSPIDGITYRLFGQYASKNRPAYYDLQLHMQKANIPVPLDIYVSRMLFFSVLGGISVSLICLLTALMVKFTSPDGTFVPWRVSPADSFLLQVISSELFLILLILGVSFPATFFLVYVTFRNYPLYKSSIRQSAIDQMLPHAVTFMHAMRSGGMSLLDIFRAINEHREIYGEVTLEFQAVVQGVELLGMDLITSLRHAATITPSDHLKNFFESTATHMESGGDLEKFLRTRADQFQAIAVQEHKTLLELLSMLAEVYVTAFVAGPLFLITILVSMGMVSSGNTGQIDLLVYIAIPLGSVMFIWLLIAMGLESDDTKVIVLKRQMDEFAGVTKLPGNPQSARILKLAALRYRIRRFLDDPLNAFVNKPYQILYLTVPIAALLFIGLAYPYFSLPYFSMISHVDDILLLAAAVAIIPFIICWELRSKKVRKMDAAVPEFLKRLASFNESGLTLTMAIKALLNSNMGVLNSEIRKIWTDIEWGADAKEALIRFEYRVNTASIRRVVTLITKASESTGDIKETLFIAAADAAAIQSEREERFLNMLLYLSIIYISFFVFLYILYTLSTVFLPVVPATPINDQLSMASAASTAASFSGGIDVEMYKLIFMHAVLIQGLFSGLVAGMMGEGNVYSGLKHSAVMILIGYVVFMLFL
ncbi:type II secretion system F family protein [Methanocella arvoryzae]|uniref:Bacterial type II secretion system protein n=1 Tax=Methanocella arvoryzae (strain DSM 22066 / NBRC 105507 / MRE50) TaxID=351160 RepID=Q0W7N1_METAR|nr:type II secretion system F family protein [Methanocella arvoryzae]CAJ35612.1 putative bacterial type II secretion system protein [Methanocella arvoryzae MRE50]